MDSGYRDLLRVAVPLMLSMGVSTLFQFLDRVMLAWHSETAVAAALPAGSVNWSVNCILAGLVSYSGTFIAQYHGGGQNSKVGPILWQALYLSLLGIVLALVLNPLAEPVFRAFGHPPDVQRDEVAYFQALNWCLFPLALGAALSGFFTGIGKTWPLLWVGALGTGVNLLCDWLLIFGKAGFPELGIRGAALGTLIGELVACACLAALVFAPSRRAAYGLLPPQAPDARLMARLARFGFPDGMQHFLEVAGVTAFVLFVGTLGTAALAATNIAFQIDLLGLLPLQGLGAAVSIRVGQALGAGDHGRARRATWSGLQLGLACIACMSVLYLTCPRVFIAPFLHSADPRFAAEVPGLAARLLAFVAVYTLFDAIQIAFSSALKGAGDTRYVMLTLACSALSILVLPAFVLTRFGKPTLNAMWALMVAFVVSLAASFAIRYSRGRWASIRLTEPE